MIYTVSLSLTEAKFEAVILTRNDQGVKEKAVRLVVT